ncbi:amino acid ABC transporter ATP-binding/permease protein [Sphingomonas sp. NPDC019816]|uniref:amino acid ABC transporter ATP-binding/permease protein n=1 Tax=Sphingomonas sp. NPDC019816 TaxID=3390679 RepID=UPI003D02E9D1
MTMSSPLARLLANERRVERRRLRQAAICAALVAAASVLLLGLSGWFLTAAALAGSTGVVAAQAFNYMLPSAGIRLLAIVRTGARYGERLAGHAAAFGALARLRPALYHAITTAPPEDALALGRGEATARLIGDVDAVELRFVRLSGPWGVAAALVSGMALALLGGWSVAGVTLVCVGAVLLIGHGLARRLDVPGRAVQRATGDLREEVAMLGDAAAELRCFALEDWAIDRIEQAGDRLAAAQRRQAAVAAGFEWLHAAGVALAAALALTMGAHAGAAIAALAALAAAMTVDAIAPVLRAMTERGRLAEAEARLNSVLTAGAGRPHATAPAPIDPASLVLDGQRVARGTRIALTGPSGCGKTTLVEGLLGLRALAAGRVLVDGRDAATLPATVRRATFAWAPQDAALIAGTVRDNLRLADALADDDRLWQALADAALDGVVRALPHGLDAWLGDDGARLSGGERRRLSLARAYLVAAPWLLLDEPVEGLDGDLAALVAARLDARLKRTGQGLIVVSHRAVLTSLCDRQWPACPTPRRSVA